MKTCLLCQRSLSESLNLADIFSFRPINRQHICQSCANQFQPLKGVKTCCQCGRRLAKGLSNPCQDCLKWQKLRSLKFYNEALFEYNDAMKNFMKQYKFMGDYRLRQIFVDVVTATLKQSRQIVVPIPIAASTMNERGFNQVLGLMQRVNYCKCLEVIDAEKQTRQSSRNRSERLSIDQPFKFLASARPKIAGKPVLIFDDVYTTGTTIRHAAMVLKAAGAASARGLTLAR